MKKKKIIEILILFICILLFSLFKIIFNSFSYDTDLLILDHTSIMNSWIGIGRYGLVFLKYIFHLYGNINLRLFNILTYLNIFIYSLLFLKFIKINNKTNIVRDILSILVIVLSPIFLEQYNFTLQSVEVSFGMILMMLSFIMTYYYLKDKKILYAIMTVLINILVFGIYQSFINLYIVGVLISLYKLNKEIKKDNNKLIIKSIIIFMISVVGYYLTNKLVINIFNIDTTSYLSSKIMWFESVSSSIMTIGKDIIRVLIGYGHVLNLSYTLCLVIVIYYILKHHKKMDYQIFYLVMILLSPFILNVLTASRMAIRSLFSFSFVVSFILYEKYDLNKYIKYLLMLVVVSELMNSSLLLYSDYKRYINDINISEKIYNDCHTNENTTIVLKGVEKSEENIKLVKGEVMGYSYFEWSNGELDVAYPRVYNFMIINNIKYRFPTNEEVDNYYKYNIKDEYPNDGYYVVDKDVCYVNLGE